MNDHPRTVAALYIDRLGPYPKMPGVDCWDEARDARKYAGPYPVIAHPPCGPWSSLRHLHTKDAERELGILAALQVARWGGVLEQPAGSRLFELCALPRGDLFRVAQDSWTIEVEQVAWGHVARKKTWLWLVGVSARDVNATVRRGGTPTHWCSGGRTKRPGMGATVPPGIKVCSAQQRRRTPTAFAEWLVSLARTVASPVRERNAS